MFCDSQAFKTLEKYEMITEARDIYLYLLYLVGGIYQSGDLKLKSVTISVQGPFKNSVEQRKGAHRLETPTTLL